MGKHIDSATFAPAATDDELTAIEEYVRTHPPRWVEDRLRGEADCSHCAWSITYSVGHAAFREVQPEAKILCNCPYGHEGRPKDDPDGCGFVAMVTLPVPPKGTNDD